MWHDRGCRPWSKISWWSIATHFMVIPKRSICASTLSNNCGKITSKPSPLKVFFENKRYRETKKKHLKVQINFKMELKKNIKQ